MNTDRILKEEFILQVFSKSGRNLHYKATNASPDLIGKNRMVTIHIPIIAANFTLECTLELLGGEEKFVSLYLQTEEKSKTKFNMLKFNFDNGTPDGREVRSFFLLRTKQKVLERSYSKYPCYRIKISLSIANCEPIVLHEFETFAVNNHNYESSPKGKKMAMKNCGPIKVNVQIPPKITEEYEPSNLHPDFSKARENSTTSEINFFNEDFSEIFSLLNLPLRASTEIGDINVGEKSAVFV